MRSQGAQAYVVAPAHLDVRARLFRPRPADDSRVRQAAWECLVRVATCYYEKLPPYMQDIFVLSQRAVKQDEEGVALQAIEFWCTICEEELDKVGDNPGAPEGFSWASGARAGGWC